MKLPDNWRWIAGMLKEDESSQVINKIMQACTDLDAATKSALSAALKYAATQSKNPESDFAKTYGTDVVNTFTGQQSADSTE